MELKPGQLWQHYKGDTYKIITFAKLEATGEDVVVYERQTDVAHSGWKIWVRSVALFQEEVEWEGGVVPRFTFMSDN
jgi:hypothetical protein